MGRLPATRLFRINGILKKARISYWVDLPQPFHYGNVQLWGWNPPMDSIVRSYMRFSELKPGRQYDVNVLNQERQRACPIG